MGEIIQDYVKTCEACQRTKPQNHKPFDLLQPLDPPQTKCTHLTMDFVTPLPMSTSRNCGQMVVVDRLNMMIRLIPYTKELDAPRTALLFKNKVYRHHGLPSCTISEGDIIFMSKFGTELFKLLGTPSSPSSAYHPRRMDKRRSSKNVEEMIRGFANYDKTNWDENLVDLEVAYNPAVHSTPGFTPLFLNYGIHPRATTIDTLSSNSPAADTFLQNIQK